MTDIEEIMQLAECIVEESNARLQKLEEPFERYAHHLKMQWHQDVKSFSHRLIQGYEALLEQLRAENSSENAPKTDG